MPAPPAGDDAVLAAALVAAYDLTPPVAVHPLPDAGGINNAVRVVRTGAGDFVWKRYAAHGDSAAIAREHRLLARLAASRLSFAVPIPLPTRDGATICPCRVRPAGASSPPACRVGRSIATVLRRSPHSGRRWENCIGHWPGFESSHPSRARSMATCAGFIPPCPIPSP